MKCSISQVKNHNNRLPLGVIETEDRFTNAYINAKVPRLTGLDWTVCCARSPLTGSSEITPEIGTEER